MTAKQLKRGILFSLMWTFAFQLHKEYQYKPIRKVVGICLNRIKYFSEDQIDIIEDLKVKAWELLSLEAEGDINLPIGIDLLYHSFPKMYGAILLPWIEQVVDLCVTDDTTSWLGGDAVTRYTKLIDKVIFDYLKEGKRK